MKTLLGPAYGKNPYLDEQVAIFAYCSASRLDGRIAQTGKLE